MFMYRKDRPYDIEDIIDDIKESKKRGKKNYIIINAEGVGDSMNMAKRIEEATGMETRATILGHMQRGGSPTCKDRVCFYNGSYGSRPSLPGKDKPCCRLQTWRVCRLRY